MAGLASLRLIINSRAALRTSSASSSSSSSSTGPPFGVGGNVKLCVPGKGLATVGVGPESAEGMIKAGKKKYVIVSAKCKKRGTHLDALSILQTVLKHPENCIRLEIHDKVRATGE